MPCVKWIRPEGRPKIFSIYKKLTSVGRAGGNDIQIDDRTLADYHAQIVFDGRDFNLNEVDPDGEMLVNGKKKRRTKIQHADRMTFGEVELHFSAFDESVDRESEEEDDDDDSRRAAEVAGLRKLHELSQRLMQSRSMQDQLEALMDTVVEATNAARGFLVLIIYS